MDDSPQAAAPAVDLEVLIEEIKKRRVLWDKYMPGYNERFRKLQLWEEVHEALYDDWKELTSSEKWIRADDIKKKWRNLRDTHAKELANERKAKRGKVRRKRPYKLSKQLSFLEKIFLKEKESSSEASEDEKVEKKRKNPNSNKEIDVELLIREVKGRPIIWNRQTQLNERADLVVRDRHWEDICSNIFTDWSRLRPTEKSLRCVDVKKRWRSLRDAFFREMNHLRKLELGFVKPKQPYRFFNELCFLQGFEQGESYAADNQQVDNEEPSSNYSLSSLEDPWAEEARPSTSQPARAREAPARTYDEDVCFAEMLVPMLKKLNDDQKHYAQVKILNVLQRARQFDPLGNVNDPKTHVVVVKNETASP